MRNRQLFIVAMVFFALFSGTVWAIKNPVVGNPMVRNPIGSGTVPPSRIQGGLIRSPAPFDISGNLIITGNVSGGKHFRGIVPYRSTSSFGAMTGSSSLDSFLRRSAGSGNLSHFSGRPVPYYSQTGTVTTTRPGRSGVFRPPTGKIRGHTTDEFTLSSLPDRETLLDSGAVVSYRRLRRPNFAISRKMGNWSMLMTPQELEKVTGLLGTEVPVSSGVGTYQRRLKLTAEQRQARMEQFQHDLKQISDRANKLEQGLIGQDDSLRLSTKVEQGEEARQWFGTQALREQKNKEHSQKPYIDSGIPGKELDVYGQMKQQINAFQKSFEQLPSIEQTKEAADVEKETGQEDPYSVGSQTPEGAVGVSAISRKMRTWESSQKKSALLDEPSGVDLSARAKSILGEHKTFASFSKDKFNQHLRAGENYLKQGKYYRATDAYTLALIYKPGEPLAYAGKSHALFAAGEYMSSALFLSRTLEIFPEYARFKIDIGAMVGDKSKLESRIADVEEWLERSGAAELEFLLGYVYYQTGRLEQAKKAIDSAYKKMPESPAVITLRKAIDEHINGR